MSDEQSGDGKIIYPTKFQRIVDRVKTKLGVHTEPVMYLDQHAFMRAFLDTPIFQQFNRLYPDHKFVRWEFHVDANRQVTGVTLTQVTSE